MVQCLYCPKYYMAKSGQGLNGTMNISFIIVSSTLYHSHSHTTVQPFARAVVGL